MARTKTTPLDPFHSDLVQAVFQKASSIREMERELAAARSSLGVEGDDWEGCAMQRLTEKEADKAAAFQVLAEARLALARAEDELNFAERERIRVSGECDGLREKIAEIERLLPAARAEFAAMLAGPLPDAYARAEQAGLK